MLGEGTGDGAAGDSGSNRGGEPEHFRLHAAVPACVGNSILFSGRDNMCAGAVQRCHLMGEENAYMVWTYVGPLDNPHPMPTEWVRTGERCIHARGDIAGRVPVAFTARDFQRLPLPPGGLNVQPDGRPALINVATNVFVDAAPVTLHATVLGRDVEVEATPSRFEWTFGDGGTLSTTDPGHAYPDMTTTHTYRRHGTWTITLTTVYSGRYRVAGETDWLPIAGTAHVASPAHPVQVIEAHAVLVP